jgi:hypothetical protein
VTQGTLLTTGGLLQMYQTARWATTGAMPNGRTGPIGYHPDDLDTALGARRFLAGYCPAAEPKINWLQTPSRSLA